LDLWRRAEPDGRAYLVEHPREALALANGKAVASVDARLGPAGNEVCASLDLLRRSALRMRRRVRDGLGEVPAEGVAVLSTARRRTATDCAEALGELESWLKSRGGAS
jgi:hypothetical protein